MATSRFRVVFHPSNPAKNEYFVDGVPVSEKVYRRESRKHAKKQTHGVPMLAGNTSSAWPLKSDALAVHPTQIAAAMERNKKHGVTGVTYDPKDGRAIFADRGARRALMRLENVHDKSGGYGDDHHIEGPTSDRGKEVSDWFDGFS